jgi:hypothetical protein
MATKEGWLSGLFWWQHRQFLLEGRVQNASVKNTSAEGTALTSQAFLSIPNGCFGYFLLV